MSIAQLLMGGGGSTQVCDSAQFDGTNDNMLRGSDLSGISDGKAGTISFWIRLDGGNGTVMRIAENTAGRSSIYRESTNVFRVLGLNSSSTTIMNFITATSYTSGATWYHILSSWDLATAGARYIYVNDASDLGTVTTFTNDTIDYTTGNYGVGATTGSIQRLNGCLAELWFATSFIDISLVANRRKFITASGKPAVLGASGQNPLGSSPVMYQRLASGAAASSFATNLGSGGDFSITGALTTGSTSPSS